ncbi:Cleavage stimulating factor 64 [Hibiscus syriacus]|uniref:Cleavage stimulating factor 64 n=1 Tax=Hibiscus syriacus TaxID=106335 RepID=A0A6A3BGZ9_HIBSY|nr:cleavage stimulating factor 64-like isoform X2 [Hibiscus syriacus]KAE8715317.1 Cleavage stimulating factor 64 [Hibiscus syriacus]
MAAPQHRCVFVGNIPYDATEEQLIEICREVGPVVSFRLVIDRETGQPKGYGFCEYMDEETALSARRNLQGYEINGRQLRVDFAENDKGSDKNREQARGGPGLATNIDSQNKGGQAVQGEMFHLQPVGLHSAINAASLMAEALGGVQAGLQHNQNALPGQPAPATDPLTLHLAKMSRSQLNEIMSELKKMATQSKERARELLLSKPQLLKAIFQAQIMLGMVTSQVLQMPNIRQPLGQHAQIPLQDAQHSQQPTAETVQTGFIPKVQSRISSVPHNSLSHNQFSATLQSTLQPRTQLPQHSSHLVLPPAASHSVVPKLPSINTSVIPQIQIQVANSSSLNRQLQPSLPHSGQLAIANLSHGSRMVLPNAVMQSAPPHPSFSDTSFQPGPSITHGNAEISNIVLNPSEAVNRPLKMVKLDGGKSCSSPFGLNTSNPQLALDVESVLLQQVLNLTPEQLSSLPPEQRQQVIQLQQALRQDQMQLPS